MQELQCFRSVSLNAKKTCRVCHGRRKDASHPYPYLICHLSFAIPVLSRARWSLSRSRPSIVTAEASALTCHTIYSYLSLAIPDPYEESGGF